jgi:hypothetical protein
MEQQRKRECSVSKAVRDRQAAMQAELPMHVRSCIDTAAFASFIPHFRLSDSILSSSFSFA